MAEHYPHPIELDEAWLAEWVAYGFTQLARYLAAHAAFDQWLAIHHRQEEPPHSERRR